VLFFKISRCNFSNIPVLFFERSQCNFSKNSSAGFQKIPVLLLDPFRMIYRCGKQMYDQKTRVEYERDGFPIHLVFFDIFKRKTGWLKVAVSAE
jgi:hypothetical protein